MNATINYSLSEAGRKASILAGGDGKEDQAIAVNRDDPMFPRVVELGDVGGDGNVLLKVGGWGLKFDRPQTAAEIIAFLDQKEEEEKARKEAEQAAIAAETRNVLKQRTIKMQADKLTLDRDGKQTSYGPIEVGFEYAVAAWPCPADEAVTSSPEAQAWVAELATAQTVKTEEVVALAREKLAELLKKEQAEAERKAAHAQLLRERKEAMGGEATDYLVRIEDGAMANVPCYESHKRGKNWFATIRPNPRSPGGLDRTFAAKAHGDLYYLLPALEVGMAVEFGADYYSSSGRKNSERWYGFVVAQNPEGLLLRKFDGGKEAHHAGIEFAKEKAVAPTE